MQTRFPPGFEHMTTQNRFPFQASVRDVTAVLFRRKWSIAVIVMTAMVASLIWLWVFRDPVYEVTAKILVRMGREQTAPSTILDQRPMIFGAGNQGVNSEADILFNRSLLAQVVDQLGLARPPAVEPPPPQLVARVRYELRAAARSIREWVDGLLITTGLREPLSAREKAIALLEGSLTVTPQRESNVVIARLRWPVRVGTSRILNTLLNLYQTHRLEIFRDESAVEFFASRVEEADGKLRSVEEQLQRFEQAGGITAIDDQIKTLLTQKAEGEREKHVAAMQATEAAARIQRLESELASGKEPDFSVLGPLEESTFPQKLLIDLSALQQQREELRMTERDDGRRIQNNRQQFDALLKLLRSTLRAHAADRQEIARTHEQVDAQFESELNALQNRRKDWHALKRSAGALEESYLFFRRKLEEATANRALDQDRIANVTVIEQAIDAFQASGMSKSTLLAVCFVVAICIAFAWVGVTELFDHRIYDADSLEAHFGLPVVTVVPRLKALGRGWPPWRRREDGPDEREAAPLMEPFRKAALSVAASRATGARAVLVSSCTRGEGVSTATLLTAWQLHETCGLRPLIVELNRRDAVLARWFHLDPDRSIQAVARGEMPLEDAVQQNGWKLSMLVAQPNGLAADSVAEVSRAFERLLTVAENRFDVVLVDGPPLLEASDGLALGRVVRHAVLVVEAERTRYQMVDRVRRDLEGAGITLIGSILNKQRRVIPGWVYGWLVR